MLGWPNDAALSVMDLLLGWLLHLPPEAALIAAAIGSAAILAVVRIFTTDQGLLGRCARDKRTLKRRIGQAKKDGGDKAQVREEVRRLRAARNMVALKGFRAEGRPLLVSIVPIVLLAVWCFARLGYHPPAADRPVELRAYFPVSAAGKLTHVVPEDGLSAEGGWVQRIEAVTEDPVPHGLATWQLRGEARREPYRLRIRYGDATAERELLVGQRIYSEPITWFDDAPGILCIEVAMEPWRPLGVVPGIPSLGFPPWLVGYLLIVVPFVFIIKRVFHIY